MTAPAPGLPEGPLVAWLGDDFTGAAATMEALAFNGLPAMLFFDPPTPERLKDFPGLRGIGVATTARARAPAWMDAELPGLFRALMRLGAPLLHYKACSTLDSAPHLGSIGRAMEIGLRETGATQAPILIAAPEMRRWQAFGNLFAAGPGGVSRLDRHPVMARHPATPMDEADVARHLARQTALPMAVLDIEALRGPAPEAALAALGAGGAALDAVDAADMAICGRLIWEGRDRRPFVVGSQGVEYALAACWRAAGALPAAPPAPSAGRARTVVVSGSMSPVTASQIAAAEADGFCAIAFDAAAALGEADAAGAAVDAAVAAALAALERGADPLVHTARGPDDPGAAGVRAAAARRGFSSEQASEALGAALGTALLRVLETSGARRCVVSGGDTSGFAARLLGVEALRPIAPTTPGAALCRAVGRGVGDGLEIALKGGQMGSEDFFARIRAGAGAP